MEEILFGDSPFVENNSLPIEKKVLGDYEYKDIKDIYSSKEEHIKKIDIYQDRSKLLKIILKLYKFICKSIKKQLWEKTERDITDDMMNAKFNIDLDKFVKESYAEILNEKNSNKILYSKISLIPIFLDFCFIYYVKFFDINAPFYKLPSNIFKFKLISNSLNKGNSTYYELDNIFKDIIKDETISDMRIEMPPFHIRNNIPDNELKEKMANHVNPILKKLINLLLTSLHP